MAEVKIEYVVDHLDREFKKALADTMSSYAPGVDYDLNALYKFSCSASIITAACGNAYRINM